MTLTGRTCRTCCRRASPWGNVPHRASAVTVLLLMAMSAADAHQVILPSSYGVLPHTAFAPLPLPAAPAPVPTFLFRSPAALPTPATPALPSDHVTPVLRAGAPAILLLPQTPTSGVYHLSDQQHRFPPFLENVVNRVQNLFSSYVQVDPFHTPLGGGSSPPASTPTASAAATALPDGGGPSAAAITTTTTTTTTARTHGQGINLRLLAPLPAHGSGPNSVPRDVELLDGRQQRAQQQVTIDGGQGKPVAFASATAQVHGGPDDSSEQDGPGSQGSQDSYLPANNNNGGNTVAERPPGPPGPPGPQGPRPGHRPGDDRRYGVRGPPRGPPGYGARPTAGRPVDPSYYRRP